MKSVHIFGLGEYADVAAYYFGPAAAAFVVNEKYMTPEHRSFPVLTWETLTPAHPLFIAVGNNRERARLYQEALGRGFELADIISPDSNIRHAAYGRHTCILEYNNVQPHVTLGDNCILWSGNHVGHHTKIGNHVFITSHVVISGGCDIGDYTFIGVNATLADHITVGEGSIIAAGATVDRDVPPDSVWGRDGLSKVPAHRVKL